MTFKRSLGLVLAAAAALSTSCGSSPPPEPERQQRGSKLDEQFKAPERSPVVVNPRTPGGREKVDPGSDKEPPEHIQKQNAELRQELKHLKGLEAERRGVGKALRSAGAIYGGIVRGSGDLIWPVNGGVVSPFGQRWGRLHAGIDIAARAGTVIHAAENGRVVISAPTGGYGNYVCVQHTARLTTCYAHLSRFLTRRGATVRQGEPLGLVGCTGHCFGDHLHFETWVGGRPVDPMRYL